MLLWLSGCAVLKLATIGRSWPQVEGIEVTTGVDAVVGIVRDDVGIPHVRATTEHDAWFALGYAHAQDRLYQADLSRHTAWGRLSSWFGARAVEFDAFAGALQLKDRAKAQLDAMDPDTRAMFDAYTAGFNAGAASLHGLPIEYRLLGEDFEPWSPEDCLAVGFLLSWALQDNLAHELTALELRDLPSEQLDALLKVDPESPPIDAYWETLRKRDPGVWSPPFAAWVGLLGGAPDRPPAPPAASNNWVVGGERTASGKPIVANDPHLSQTVPALWYAAEIKGGDLHVAGVTLPGTPGVVIGHDERVAWGLTNVMADLTDLVVLEKDGEGYLYEGVHHDLEQRTVTIEVDDGEPQTRTVRYTAVGPVVNDGGEYLLALRWATLELHDRLPEAVRALNRATNTADVLAATHDLPLKVALNLVIADVDGDYGWRAIGSMVGRRMHTGRVPYPGSDPAHGWFGWLSDTPEAHHPERGYVQTANSRPDHPLADHISTSYVPPLRFRRIGEQIEAHGERTPEMESELQKDVSERLAVVHRDELLDGVVPDTEPGKRCLAVLRNWDLHADTKSEGAAVWALFLEQYVRLAIEDQIGEKDTAVALSVLSTARGPFDNGVFASVFVEDRAKTVSAALDRACTEGVALANAAEGADPAGTALPTWGAIHPMVLRHNFTANAPKLLASWNMPEVPAAGSGATVSATNYDWGKPGVRKVTSLPSMRLVMPLADLGASTFVQPGGESGQPGNEWYKSHFTAYATGTTAPLWFDDDDLAAHITHSLVLRPGGSL